MVPGGWHSYSLSALLLEENKNEPVDTNARSWALIAYDFSPWKMHAYELEEQLEQGID